MGSAGTWQGSMTPRAVVVLGSSLVPSVVLLPLPWGQRSVTGDYLGGVGGRETLVLDKVIRSRYQVDGWLGLLPKVRCEEEEDALRKKKSCLVLRERCTVLQVTLDARLQAAYQRRSAAVALSANHERGGHVLVGFTLPP
jgi:hypothetical protein